MKPGEQVDRYVLEGELGRGGMGEVYEALDTKLARKVALKLLLPGADATATQRMVREARAAAAFSHPNAVVVYDVGEAGGATFIAMELVRGKPMRRYVGEPSVPVGRRVRWLVDVARALAAAHDAGLVHRDVKPDNVMIRDDGAVKVLDFGIARRPTNDHVDPSAPTEANALPTLTERGMVVGTPLYASPEQLRSEPLDGRSDQFSWGVMAHELFAGRPPWRTGADALALLSQILSSPAQPLGEVAPEVPAEVAAVVARALAKTPAERYATMHELADALEPFADAAAPTGRDRAALPSSVKSVTPPPTQVARLARRTGRVVFVVLAVFGGLVAAALFAAGLPGHLVFDVGAKHDAGAAAAAAPVVASLACKPATVEGAPAKTADLMARAIGIGACARLAAALDVDWLLEGGATPLDVRAKLEDGRAAVTLDVLGKRATSTGATPVDALAAASADLAKQLAPAKLTPDQVKAWGASDEASARRIERVWRELVLNLTPNHVTAIQALIKSDGGSPWPHALAALTLPNGSSEQEAARKKALDLAGLLPPARAEGLRGVLAFITGEAGRASGIEELRKSYRDAPDDADIAGLFAAVAMSAPGEEGWAVLDRLVAKFPTKSVLALNNAVSGPSDRDLERSTRYLDKLHAILPETSASFYSVENLAVRGKLDEARDALAFGDRFGLSGSAADASRLAEARVFVELAAEDGQAVRRIATPLLGDPRPEIALYGARAMAWADWLDGRFDDALEEERRIVDLTRGAAGKHELVPRVLGYALDLRLLGRRPADGALLDEAEKAVEESGVFRPTERAAAKALLTYARAPDPKKAKRELERALAELDRLAEAAPDRTVRES
ncbi:MAG TPA: serine/threonine-protein kinase, partial [Minicystis sp.]|nr:serine/threonine-protein kinase [Minicystis sp.]